MGSKCHFCFVLETEYSNYYLWCHSSLCRTFKIQVLLVWIRSKSPKAMQPLPQTWEGKKRSPPCLGRSFTLKVGWERPIGFQNGRPLLGLYPVMWSLFQNETHPHTNAKPRLTHSDDLSPEQEHILCSSYFFKGWRNVSCTIDEDKLQSSWKVHCETSSNLFSHLLVWEGGGIWGGTQGGKFSLRSKNTFTCLCEPIKRGSDFKSWFLSDDGTN